jgi:hypothetical protein
MQKCFFRSPSAQVDICNGNWHELWPIGEFGLPDKQQRGSLYLLLRSSLVLAFLPAESMNGTHPLWLWTLIRRFIHTNEERSTKELRDVWRVGS